jgi:hypothetical protein
MMIKSKKSTQPVIETFFAQSLFLKKPTPPRIKRMGVTVTMRETRGAPDILNVNSKKIIKTPNTI